MSSENQPAPPDSPGAPDPEARDVFVSYSSSDRESAEALVVELEKEGMRCWVAPRDVKAGSSYAEEILEGIETSNTMALLLSRKSNDSGHVQREVERALNLKKPIIPIRLEDIMPSQAMDYYLAGVHWIDALDDSMVDNPGKVAAKIAAQLGEVREREAPAPTSPVSGFSKTTPNPSPTSTSAKKKPLIIAGSIAAALLIGLIIWIALSEGDDSDDNTTAQLATKAEQLLVDGLLFDAQKLLQTDPLASKPDPSLDALKGQVTNRIKILGSEAVQELRAIKDGFQFTFGAADGKSKVHLGQDLEMFVESEIECYFVVVGRSADDSAPSGYIEVVVYPNQWHSDYLLPKGERRQIPGAKAKLEAAPPTGPSLFYAVASSDKSALDDFIKSIDLETVIAKEEGFKVLTGRKFILGAATSSTSERNPAAKYAKRVITVEVVD